MSDEAKDFHDAWQEFLTEAFGFGQSAASKRSAQQGPVNLKNIRVVDAEAEEPQLEQEEFPADGLRRILHFVDEIGATDAERQRKILEELEKMLAEQKLTIKEEFVPDTQASSMKHQAALLGDRNRASFIWDETKFPTLSKLLFQLQVREYDNYVTLMELFITAGFSIKSVNAVDKMLTHSTTQDARNPPKPQPAQEPSPEEAPEDDETQDIQGRSTDEEEHSGPEEEVEPAPIDIDRAEAELARAEAAKKKRGEQNEARQRNRQQEHIEIGQENTELLSESVINQWQKLAGINPRVL